MMAKMMVKKKKPNIGMWICRKDPRKRKRVVYIDYLKSLRSQERHRERNWSVQTAFTKQCPVRGLIFVIRYIK